MTIQNNMDRYYKECSLFVGVHQELLRNYIADAHRDIRHRPNQHFLGTWYVGGAPADKRGPDKEERSF